VALRPLADGDVRVILARDMPEAAAEALDRAVGLAGGRPRRGFEALLMGDNEALGALESWLADPGRPPPAAPLALPGALTAGSGAGACGAGPSCLCERAVGQGARPVCRRRRVQSGRAADPDRGFRRDPKACPRPRASHRVPMTARNAFYVTTAIAYPNGEPHI